MKGFFLQKCHDIPHEVSAFRGKASSRMHSLWEGNCNFVYQNLNLLTFYYLISYPKIRSFTPVKDVIIMNGFTQVINHTFVTIVTRYYCEQNLPDDRMFKQFYFFSFWIFRDFLNPEV